MCILYIDYKNQWEMIDILFGKTNYHSKCTCLIIEYLYESISVYLLNCVISHHARTQRMCSGCYRVLQYPASSIHSSDKVHIKNMVHIIFRNSIYMY